MNERFLATAAVALGLGAAFGSGTGGSDGAEVGGQTVSVASAPAGRQLSQLPEAVAELPQAPRPDWSPSGVISRTDAYAVAVAAVGTRSRSGGGGRSTSSPNGPRSETGGLLRQEWRPAERPQATAAP